MVISSAVATPAMRRALLCGLVSPVVIAACAGRSDSPAVGVEAGIPAQSPAVSELIGAAGEVARIAPRVSTAVWPGFWPVDEPFILYDLDESVTL